MAQDAKPAADKTGAVAKVLKLVEKLQRTRALRANTHLSAKGGEIFSAGMSFQAVFAVFAAIFVGFSVFGYFLRGNEELVDSMSSSISEMVPGLVGPGGALNLHDLVNDSALTWGGVIGAASLLLVIVTWFTSTRTVIRIINDMDVKEYGNPILLKLKDFGMSLLFGLMLLVASAVSLGSTAVLNIVGDIFGRDNWIFGGTGLVLRYGLMFLVYWLVVFAIHKWLAGLPHRPKQLWKETILGAAGLLILTLLGSSLLGGATKNPLLAPFAIIIGLLLWFNFVSRVLLFNASWIAVGADKQLGLPDKILQEDAAATAQKVAALQR